MSTAQPLSRVVVMGRDVDLWLCVTAISRALGAAVKNAAQLLDRFCANDIVIEVTHRSKRRLFGLAALASLREASRRRPGRNRAAAAAGRVFFSSMTRSWTCHPRRYRHAVSPDRAAEPRLQWIGCRDGLRGRGHAQHPSRARPADERTVPGSLFGPM